MKIAISSDGEMSTHLGRCKEFIIFNINENKIVNNEVLKNPVYGNHKPGVLPKFLISQKVNVVITGAAGPQAIELLESAGVEVKFANGKIQELVNQYLEGKLGKGENICSH